MRLTDFLFKTPRSLLIESKVFCYAKPKSFFYNKGVALVRTTPCGKCDPVGIQPQDLQNFFSTRIFCFKNKKGVALVRTTPCGKCDPVGIQTQDLQNFFSTRIFCFKNKKGVAWKCYTLLCDPVGIQTQDLQNRNLTLYSAKLRDPQNQRMQN